MDNKSNTDIKLTIIILTYNTKEITLGAIRSIEENYGEQVQKGQYQIIIVDNASTDGSLDFFKNYKKKTKIKFFEVIDNGGNLGFSKGNNKGIPLVKDGYVLFLNPDTIVYKNTLTFMLEFMERHPDAGVSSCKLVNKDGQIDFNCHRGFPTPWNAFCYFSGLTRMFPKSRFFAGYTLGWENMDTVHEVDAVEGAFMLVPFDVGKKIGWWDEDYFFYGEDLQFCYNVKSLGYKVYYVGDVSIMHIGGASSGIKKKSESITTANIQTKKRLQIARFEAMKIFYRKNYKNKYPGLVFSIVNIGINFLENRAMRRLNSSVS